MDNQSDESSQHFSQPIQPQPSQPYFQQGQPSQPVHQQPYPSGPMPPQKLSPRQRFARLPLLGRIGLIAGAVLLLLCVCFSGLAAYGSTLPQPTATPATIAGAATETATPRPRATRQPTATKTPTATGTAGPSATATTPRPSATPTVTPTPKPIYPPTSAADLHALAAKGDASALHTFDVETVGLTGVCPQPKREVTVDPSITGQQLVEDLLAYFYANGLDSPCGSVVFAYHTQAEASDVYTAGRILVDTQNMDPNNTNAQRTMTLDSGGLDDPNAQEYTITYI